MSLSKNIILKNLKRYNINKRKYYFMKINTIIYNKKSHYVSKFKELLFLNDLNEFLIQYYPSFLLKIFFSKFLFSAFFCFPLSKFIRFNIVLSFIFFSQTKLHPFSILL